MKHSLCLVVIVVVCLAATADDSIELPLEITRGENCWFDGQSARLLDSVWAPDGDGRISIEAENPSRYYCNPARRLPGDPLPTDDAASGGGYLDELSYARYDLVVDTAATYTLWARVATGVGKYMFRHYVDGRGITGPFLEDNEKEGQTWHWVTRGQVKLDAGSHWLEVVKYAYSFPKIDKWVLSPDKDWQPNVRGPEAASRKPEAGWVETADVEIPGLLKLTPGAQWPAAVAAELSFDAGATWTPLAEVNWSTAAGKPLRLRFALSSGQRINGLRVAATVESGRLIQLADAQTRLVLDRDTGGLLLIENLLTGEPVVNPGRPRPLFNADFKKQGAAVWTRVSPEYEARLEADRRNNRWYQKETERTEPALKPDVVQVRGNGVEVVYSLGAGDSLAQVTYTIEPGENGTWRFAVTGKCKRGPADLVSIAFPLFEHVKLGASGLDDHQLRMQSFGHHTVQPGNAPIRDERYLGGVVMPWQSVYDERGGFYVGSHDPSATNLLFESKAGGLASEHFTASFRKLEDLKPGEEQTFEYRVAAHGPGWHFGADRYREWFYKTHGKAEYPDWVKKCDGWVGLQAENYGRSFRFDQIPDWLTRAQAVGLDWVQVWGQFAYDGGPCCSNFYALSPLYGGEHQWKEACAKVRQRGGHVGAYFLYHGLDMLPLVSDFFLGHFKHDEYAADTKWVDPEFFRKVRLVDDPGNVVPPFPPDAAKIDEYQQRIEEHQKLYANGERASPVHWWVGTYVNDPAWVDYLKYWIIDKYQREHHNDTVYMDVLGTGRAPESFDPRRGHNGDGGYGRGRLLIAKTIAEEASKINPDYVPTMEGMGDLPGLYCASMCSGVYRGGRNVMRYTFPERIFIHGNANHGSGGGQLDRFLETFLEGMRYDSQGRYAACPVHLLNLQRQFTPWLYEATFRDTVGLEVSSPKVKARLFRVESEGVRGALLTIVNREGVKDVTVSVDAREVGSVGSAFFVDSAGSAGTLELGRAVNPVTFHAPTALATLIFLSSPDNGVVYPLTYLRRHGEPELQVTLLNTSIKSRRTGVCRIENQGLVDPFGDRQQMAQKALPFAQTEAAFDVGPGKSTTVSFPVVSLKEHWWTVRVRVTVEAEGIAPLTRERLLMPLVLGGSWELMDGDDAQSAHGARSLRLGPTTSGFQHQLPNFWLEPEHRYRFTVKQMRTGFKADVRGVRLNVWHNSGHQDFKNYHADPAKPGEWQTLSDEFETPRELTRAALYLYNVRSPDTAWFDELQVEDLGPVDRS